MDESRNTHFILNGRTRIDKTSFLEQSLLQQPLSSLFLFGNESKEGSTNSFVDVLQLGKMYIDDILDKTVFWMTQLSFRN